MTEDTKMIGRAVTLCEIYEARGELDAGSQARNIYHETLKDYRVASELLAAIIEAHQHLGGIGEDATLNEMAARQVLDSALAKPSDPWPDSSSPDSVPPSKDSSPQKDT